MTDAEIMVRTSIQVFQTDPKLLKPVGFGSGCIVEYLERVFFLSVSHVTDTEGLTTCLETNQPADARGQVLKPIGGICYFDQIKVTPDTSLEDFDSLLQNGERLDISFAEVKEPIGLLQPALDFGAFKVEAGIKLPLFMHDAVVPTKDERYGFYGRIKPKYEGKVLRTTPTLKHSLKFHRQKDNFYLFLAPQTIEASEDYEGCSGAPILDSNGRLVALACMVLTGSKIIYGFSIHECKRLLDIAIQTKML